MDAEGRGGQVPPSLYMAMAVQFAAGGALLPFVTLLLRDRGFELAQISTVFSSASATLLVFPFLWGMLADRFIPLNQLFLLLNLGSAATLAVFYTQTSFTGCLLSYTGFFAFFTPTLSLVTALSFHHLPRPAEQFGKLRAWGSWGWIVPFLPISLLLAFSGRVSLEFTVIICIGICVLMAGLSFWLPHTPPRARVENKMPHRRGYVPAIRMLLCTPDYLIALASMFLVSGSYFLLLYYSPPHLEDLGVPRPWIGPAQATGVIFEAILLPWQAAMIRRFNYRTVLLVGCLALLARHLLFVFVSDPWVLSFSYLLGGMVIVFFHMGLSVLVNAIAAAEVRATAQTLLTLFGQGLGPVAANWAVPWFSARFGGGLRPVFIYAALLAGLATMIIAVRGRRLNLAGAGRPTG
jgi:MFS family permease